MSAQRNPADCSLPSTTTADVVLGGTASVSAPKPRLFGWNLLPGTQARLAGVGTLLASAALITATPLLPPNAAEAATASRFVCSSVGGVPTTEAITRDGRKVSVIRWTSRVFSGSGWTAERRCQEVSSRFDQFRQQGRLRYITTGRMRGQSVLCTAQSMAGACDGLLYTLKPGQDPSATLARLLELRVKARGPLNETGPRLYISVDALLEPSSQRLVDADVAGSSVASIEENQPRAGQASAPLW